jgi:hypothetical protein
MFDAKIRMTAFVLLAMVIDGCGATVDKANETSCRANLLGIATACELYRGRESNMKYPENLQALVDNRVIDPHALQCPSDRSQRACSYLYAAPVPDAEDRTLMLCDLKGNHDQIRNVAFKNRAVKSMTEAQFQAELKLPRNAAFAAALEKAGG